MIWLILNLCTSSHIVQSKSNVFYGIGCSNSLAHAAKSFMYFLKCPARSRKTLRVHCLASSVYMFHELLFRPLCEFVENATEKCNFVIKKFTFLKIHLSLASLNAIKTDVKCSTCHVSSLE